MKFNLEAELSGPENRGASGNKVIIGSSLSQHHKFNEIIKSLLRQCSYSKTNICIPSLSNTALITRHIEATKCGDIFFRCNHTMACLAQVNPLIKQ